jgi:hopanoid biosynthesis associated protein HpnK
MRERQLIVTADDFGMSLEVNEAVEAAHRNGVLTCASLVVAGPAAADAVRRARRLPALGVGLHLALLDAPCASDPRATRLLCDGDTLGRRPVVTGARIALSREARAQARRELTAQLDGFARTRLRLDHVNGHWHFHEHPSVIRMLTELAPAYGIRAIRAPREPAWAGWRAAGRRGLASRLGARLGHAAIWSLSRPARRRSGLRSNRWFFGLANAGALDAGWLLAVLTRLPAGLSEIGLHPATAHPGGPFAPPDNWRPEVELAALMHPDVVRAARSLRLGRFADFEGAPIG